MSNNRRPVYAVIAGIVFAGAAGYYLYKNDQFSFPGSGSDSATVQTEAKQAENLDDKTQETAKLSSDAETDGATVTQVPDFDVLRVEPDGSAVIAGTAPANSTVELVDAADGNRVVGQATALPSGDYAIVLEEPLKPGKHELYIVSKMKDGTQIQSADAGLIEVPTKEKGGEPIVIVTSPDSPTRVLQDPETEIAALEPEKAIEEVKPETNTEPVKSEETAEVEEKNKTEKAIVTPEPKAKPAEEPKTEQETEVAKLTEEAETNETETAKPQAKKIVRPVLLQAADVEDGKIYIAGQGEPGGTINIYFDDALLGSTTVAENGAFLFEGERAIEPGSYSIRADMVEGNNISVLARAEVNLVHQPEVDLAEVKKQEAQEEKPAEPKDTAQLTPEPTQDAEKPAETVEEKEIEVAENTQDAATTAPETEAKVVTEKPEQPKASEETQQEVASNTATETASDNVENSTAKKSEEPKASEEAQQEVVANNNQTESATAESEEVKKPELTSDDFNNRVEEKPASPEATETETANAETATEKTQVAELRTGTSVIIRRGDSLWRVARRNYGQGIRYTTIFKANQDQIRDPDLIYPGQVFDIPEEAEAGSSSTSG